MRLISPLAIAALLAACSSQTGDPSGQAGDAGGTPTTAEMAAPADAASGNPANPDNATKLPISLPKLTYSYALSYLVPGDRIAATQDAHRDLCEEMGPARCQLIGLERGIGDAETNRAMLKLRVATAEARRFQILLDHGVTEAGGRTENARIATDEVSKQIVDTEARIRQRELLVARLTEALRTRSGKPSELVAAERSVTEAQEELDQARGWLGELRGRVAMSEFDIHYGAIAPAASAQGLGVRLGEAAQGSGAVFLIGLNLLLSLLIYVLPWLALLALPVLVLRGLRKRRLPAEAG
ncbi:hypothetical protein FHS95_000670 [Sphingomonas naasensis]|uniref:DUF4349 domain-containing protein n=1 Tax=Sphingomonas naasensis TaxID=1344951 RepID=A0A4S1WX67_9SPHN|nr:DUF4349 domain-containing protein [Sphingomonas naasensis]NIJ19001.1 hypothetical protein [Sphingomonas naasensis]TGX46206.1 DUF4349 domain-containing protein [Sphingomonas naasensis]